MGYGGETGPRSRWPCQAQGEHEGVVQAVWQDELSHYSKAPTAPQNLAWCSSPNPPFLYTSATGPSHVASGILLFLSFITVSSYLTIASHLSSNISGFPIPALGTSSWSILLAQKQILRPIWPVSSQGSPVTRSLPTPAPLPFTASSLPHTPL